MDKENGDRDKASAPENNPLNLFAAGHGMLGGGLPGSYSHHLSNAASAYSALLGASGSRGGQYPPTTSSYSNLNVAASQAASLGINPGATWWTMASHLAAQDYLARLQSLGIPTDMTSFPWSQNSQGSGKQSTGSKSLSHTSPSTATSGHHRNSQIGPGQLNDPAGVLGGVRLPPDTEIIKYTSSIIGPKVPGTTNRGRKKTISLDPPSVSVTPTQSLRATKSQPENQMSPHLSNGQITPPTSIYPPASPSDCDAPLNLSLKPASSTPQTANSALQSLSSLSQSLGNVPDRVSRRKPGPKPRRVTSSPLPPPGPAPSASLAQLFAAADSPHPHPHSHSHPSSVGDESDSSSHHKDGRPRNLGRGVSKPKKNTVASLLAQSRALGLKPGLDFGVPLNQTISMIKANLQQKLNAETEGEIETEDKPRTSSPNSLGEYFENEKRILQQGNTEKRSLGSHSENSSVLDTNSESEASDSDADTQGTKRPREHMQDDSIAKKQKVQANADELRLPLEKGWKRETFMKGVGKYLQIRGDVVYTSPSGSLCKNHRDILEYLEKNSITDLNSDNFSFSTKVIIGDYITRNPRGKATRINVEDVKNAWSNFMLYDPESEDADNTKVEKESVRELKKTGKEESAKAKELTRFLKEQDRCEKQEALKKDREQRNIQMTEARKKRQEEAGKLKQEEQQRKQQERGLKRQQTALLKEQIYMQELGKQRELLYTVELERERRRQHMALVKLLEMRKKQEEKEKRRLEVKAEKMATIEKRLEERRIELDLLTELRKPVEDLELPDLKPLPELDRIPGLKLAGQAFADTLMVYEFLHNFGETLGFDMGSLPTLNSLQNALLGDEEAEEELLSVMTHLIICAIEDPGIPNPARHTTLLGQSLKQADISHTNISEILRIYLYANATGEVKALTGVQFEREREKKMSDHHNNMNESAGEESECGRNAAFFVALRENPTWKMSESLKHKPFLVLNATQKAKILQFLCHELLQNKAVIRQVEGAIETVAQLKRDHWTIESKLKKLRHLHSRKLRQMPIPMMGVSYYLDGPDEEPNPPKDHEDDDDGDGESGNESEGTQPEEDEDKKLSMEEVTRKLEKLGRQAEQTLTSLSESEGQLRAICYGQDRYWRRYWCLPAAGGLFVEGIESAEPELFNQLLEEDSYSSETPDIRSEYNAEDLQGKLVDDDEEMPHLTPEVDTESLFSKIKQEESINEEPEPAKLVDINRDVKDNDTNEKLDEMEVERSPSKNDCSGGEEDNDTKTMTDDNKSQSFQMDEKSFEDMAITNGIGEQDPTFFSVLPREPCDPSTLTSTASAFRCGTENSELRIPVFPPPPVSPSPSQCDSPFPAPLNLSPEEAAQLERCKKYGLPQPAPLKVIPYDLRCGWWRITDLAVLQKLVDSLHTRGGREKELRRSITRSGFLDINSLKVCLRKGSATTELHTCQQDQPTFIPPRDGPNQWNYEAAMRVDMAVLEQVETMEDKVASASMQVKGWKLPARASTEEGRKFQPSCSHPPPELNPIAVAKARLLELESAIERRYLKPPLGVNVLGVDVAHIVIAEPDTIPKGLVIWREAVSKSQTAAQLSMGLHMLEASIAWDKSIMKANCQFCHSGDNEDKLLLCDGCDKGYHTYCFKPKMDNIPEGDWYCYECMNKATGDKCCIVCGKKLGRNLVVCDNCPKAYHTDCLQPPLTKVPRGKWHCNTCLAKLPRKRLSTKRTVSTSPLSRSCEDGSVSNTDFILSPAVVEEAPPESPPPLQLTLKKEKSGTKKMAKEMAPCKQLLDDLESHDEAWPFLLPVNTKQFPTYKKIIKNPMDFSTIKKRLTDSIYKSREEFCSDVRLIFNNCETFNEDDSPVGKAGHSMRLFFETRWTELTNQKSSC